MKFVKGLALGLLSFILFLSLSIFGLAFTLNNTILNPDFVVSELDKLDVPSLAEELISEQVSKEELPEEFGTALVNTINKLAPLVKEQVSAATYSIFDYLLGKSQSPDLALTLRNTILNTDFVVSLVDEIDIPSLAGEFLREQLTEEIPEEMDYLVESLDESLDDVISELEPWIKEQVSVAADPILDYILGESQSLNVVISLEPVKESLRDNVKQALLQSPPPQVQGIPPAEIEMLFDKFYQGFSEQMPSTFELDESLLGTEMPTQIAEALAKAEEGLEQARQAIGYFQLGFKFLIALILLTILGIILINHEVRGTTRELGTTFIIYGAIEYLGILATKYFMGTQLSLPEIPQSLQAWIPQLFNDFLAPLEMFSLGILVCGIVLLIVSFVYKPRQQQSGL